MKPMMILMLMMCAAHAHAQQDVPHPKAVQRGQSKLSFDREEPCSEHTPHCTYGRRFHVKVEGKNGAHDVVLEDSARIHRVSDLRMLNEKRGVVVTDDPYQPGDGLTIVDMDTGQIVDTIVVLGWSASPSPDGRYIALVDWYPPHGDPNGMTDVVRVYDTTLSPEANRPDKNFDGFFVYNKNGYAFTEADFHRVSPAKWLDNDTFVFSDRHGSQEKLVVADLRDGPQQPKVFVEVLNNYCKAGSTDVRDLNRTPKVPMLRVLNDFAHADGTDTVSFTLEPCGKVEVHVPGLR